MRRIRRTLVLLAVSLCLATCSGLNNSPRGIEPAAQEPLRAMDAVLASAKAFEFDVAATVDEMSDAGYLVQGQRKIHVMLRRPDGLAVQVAGDGGSWSLRYSGRALTLVKEESSNYATVAAPATVDAMLDFLFDKYGVTIPLADLLFADPYATLTERVESGVYLGRHMANGVMCHHLLFTQENVDWQIWIDAGAQPLPRKVVITRKNEPGAPEYEAEISGWNLSPAVAEDTFRFKAPAGAKAVDMATLWNERGNGP